MSNPPRKGLMDSLVNAAKASAEELLDRGRAVAHDVAARTGTDEAANERSRLAAAEARARADVRRSEYEADMADLSQSIERGVEGGLAKAGELAGRARMEATRAAERAQDMTRKAGKDMQDAAARMRQDAERAAGSSGAPPGGFQERLADAARERTPTGGGEPDR